MEEKNKGKAEFEVGELGRSGPARSQRTGAERYRQKALIRFRVEAEMFSKLI
jgi:hypothetical protein